MGYPDIYQFNDSASAQAAANSCPLESTPMIDPKFNEVYCLTKPNQNACFLAPDELLLKQLSDKPADSTEPQVCRADTHEKRGPLDVSINDQGEITSITNEAGVKMERQADGKFVVRNAQGEIMQTVENVKVDAVGNIQYDVSGHPDGLHVEFNVDGSFVLQDNVNGRIVTDKAGNVIEAPSGNGRVRKFQYENGQLVGIDGNLGHWDRVEENGQVSWKNKDSGAVWHGDFGYNSQSNNLEFRGRNGTAWAFTAKGEDVPLDQAKK
ncbi:MAG: hypothetical protein DKT66_24885 [Candidatus Melainabacteria bacterium]|nr:MAG: hypothetical protein DKT66_24885 [Candidatus Melainabacteria bacterium]